MELSRLIYGVLIFSFVFLVGTIGLNSMSTNYDIDYDDSLFNETLNKIDETYSLSAEMETGVSGAEISNDQSWESMTKAPYSSIQQFTGIFGIIYSLFNDVSEVIGIPPQFIVFAITAILIFFTFGVIKLIMGAS